MLSFCTILIKIWYIIPALTGEKLNKISRKNIPITYLSKMRQLLAKNLFLVFVKLQIHHTSKLSHGKKKPQNYFFSQGSGTLWKWDLKYTNMFYFFSSSQNIWCLILRLVFNSSHLLMFCNCSRQFNKIHWEWIELLILRVLKVKLNQNIHPNILSEIIIE